MASVGFIDVGCPDVQERVPQIIVSNNLKITIGSHDLKVARAETEAVTARNSALRKASDLLKKVAGVEESSVHIEWIGERGVKVGDAFAFKQPSGADTGAFCGKFGNLRLA